MSWGLHIIPYDFVPTIFAEMSRSACIFPYLGENVSFRLVWYNASNRKPTAKAAPTGGTACNTMG